MNERSDENNIAISLRRSLLSIKRILKDLKPRKVYLPNKSPYVLMTDASLERDKKKNVIESFIGGMLFTPTGNFHFRIAYSRIAHLFPGGDPNINQLELFAVVVALTIWKDKLEGKFVISYIDNSAALYCAIKGRSPKCTMNAIAHVAQILLTQHSISVWFDWVASAYNLADLMTRCTADYEECVSFFNSIDCSGGFTDSDYELHEFFDGDKIAELFDSFKHRRAPPM